MKPFRFVDAAAAADLSRFVSFLEKWQVTHNLVSDASIRSVWMRHVADSLQLWEHAPAEFQRWLDLGSGAGFPGLVLAIAAKAHPERHFVLVESNHKKAAFLREAARQAKVKVTVLAQRIEAYAATAPARFDVVSARALAALPDLCRIAAPFLNPVSGLLLLLKGRDFERELQEAAKSWVFDVVVTPSLTDPDGRILALRNLFPKVQQ